MEETIKVREISIFWLKSQGSLILKFCGNPVSANYKEIPVFAVCLVHTILE